MLTCTILSCTSFFIPQKTCFSRPYCKLKPYFMQQNNVLAAIVAVAKKEHICYSVYPPEIYKFRVKTFQAAQLTHKIFFTLNHLSKIFICCIYRPVHKCWPKTTIYYINENFNTCGGTMNNFVLFNPIRTDLLFGQSWTGGKISLALVDDLIHIDLVTP